MLSWPRRGSYFNALNEQQMNDLTTYINKNGIDHLGLEERKIDPFVSMKKITHFNKLPTISV